MYKIIILLSSIFISSITQPVFADTVAAPTFTLTTNAFLDEGILPVIFTCDGKDISPQFEWSNVPAKTKAFAFILADHDAPGGTFYHWVLYDIPANTTSLAEGVDKLPAGTKIGKNNFAKSKYNGPCPPKGAAHSYIFTLYALDATLNVPTNADGSNVLEAMKNHVLGQAKLTTVYSRWINA